MQNYKLSLAKHPQENRTLMCWYKVHYRGGVVQFRSSCFISTELEDILHKHHCNYSGSALLQQCEEILAPHMTAVLAAIDKHVELDEIVQLLDTNKLQIFKPLKSNLQ